MFLKALRLGLAIMLALSGVLGLVYSAWAPSHPVVLKSVDIENFTFRETTITVFPEMVVAWTNKDPVIHTVTSLTGAFDSGNLNSEETFQFTFNRPGVYEYFCSIHPFMTGKVIVLGTGGGIAQFDTNGNGVIDDAELFFVIDQWVAGSLSDELFFQVLDAWVAQTPVAAASTEKSLIFAAHATRRAIVFMAHGQGVAALRVEVFRLSGTRVFAQEAPGTRLLWDWSAQLIANGVYLYAITARDLQGRMLSRTFQKLMILR